MSLTDSLLTLYRVEAQVRGLRGRLESAQNYLTAQTQQLEELREQHQELRTRTHQIQAKIGNLEGETAAIDTRIEKLRNELNMASTNKQYTAVLTELNTVKLSRNEVDDQILEEMERIDQIKEQLAKLDSDIAERDKIRASAENELQRRNEEVGDRLAELEAQREVAAAEVPAAERAIFNEMADTYSGEAMAAVKEISRRSREYACGECNMYLPFETVAALMGAINTLVRCHACGRILFLQDETRGALAKR